MAFQHPVPPFYQPYTFKRAVLAVSPQYVSLNEANFEFERRRAIASAEAMNLRYTVCELRSINFDSVELLVNDLVRVGMTLDDALTEVMRQQLRLMYFSKARMEKFAATWLDEPSEDASIPTSTSTSYTSISPLPASPTSPPTPTSRSYPSPPPSSPRRCKRKAKRSPKSVLSPNDSGARITKPKSTSGTDRLKPHEFPSAGKPASKAHRFCWNIGFWQIDRLGADADSEHQQIDDAASGLFKRAHNPQGMIEVEKKCSNDFHLSVPEYRKIRARILVGFACLYEHNLRGAHLNSRKVTHPALRPEKDSYFDLLNMGLSQAQMICYGTDVKKAGAVFRACQAAGHLPADEVLAKVGGNNRAFRTAELPGLPSKTRVSLRDLPYPAIPELEAIFPREERQRLYAGLQQWYAREEDPIPAQLQFVIPDAYVADSRWNLSPPGMAAVPAQES